MEDNVQTNPLSRLNAIRSLAGHPGWPVFCARFDKLIELQIEAQVWDRKTGHEQRAMLVEARNFLTQHCTPEKLRAAIAAQAESELDTLEKRRESGRK